MLHSIRGQLWFLNTYESLSLSLMNASFFGAPREMPYFIQRRSFVVYGQTIYTSSSFLFEIHSSCDEDIKLESMQNEVKNLHFEWSGVYSKKAFHQKFLNVLKEHERCNNVSSCHHVGEPVYINKLDLSRIFEAPLQNWQKISAFLREWFATFVPNPLFRARNNSPLFQPASNCLQKCLGNKW